MPIIVFEPYQQRHGSVEKSIVLLEHKCVLLVPEHFLYWLQQISIHEYKNALHSYIRMHYILTFNVRMQVEIFTKDYQIANAMDADASANHNRNFST